MDSRAFELLMKIISENKQDSVKRMDEMRSDMAEIKKLVEESRDFRMKLVGGSIGVSAIIAFGWHVLELITK